MACVAGRGADVTPSSTDCFQGLYFMAESQWESDLLKYLGCENSHTVTDVKSN